MTTAPLATNPALPLLAQREFGIGVALCVVALTLAWIAMLLFRLAALTDWEAASPIAAALASTAVFFALVLLLNGIPRVVAPRGMALGAQVYGSRKAGLS